MLLSPPCSRGSPPPPPRCVPSRLTFSFSRSPFSMVPFFSSLGGGQENKEGTKLKEKAAPVGTFRGGHWGGGDTSGLSPSSMHAALHLQHRALLLGLWG